MTEEAQEQEPSVQVGDIVHIQKGENKGQDAKVIAVYTNSVAVELEAIEKNGKPARTVINNSKYMVNS